MAGAGAQPPEGAFDPEDRPQLTHVRFYASPLFPSQKWSAFVPARFANSTQAEKNVLGAKYVFESRSAFMTNAGMTTLLSSNGDEYPSARFRMLDRAAGDEACRLLAICDTERQLDACITYIIQKDAERMEYTFEQTLKWLTQTDDSSRTLSATETRLAFMKALGAELNIDQAHVSSVWRLIQQHKMIPFRDLIEGVIAWKMVTHYDRDLRQTPDLYSLWCMKYQILDQIETPKDKFLVENVIIPLANAALAKVAMANLSDLLGLLKNPDCEWDMHRDALHKIKATAVCIRDGGDEKDMWLLPNIFSVYMKTIKAWAQRPNYMELLTEIENIIGELRQPSPQDGRQEAQETMIAETESLLEYVTMSRQLRAMGAVSKGKQEQTVTPGPAPVAPVGPVDTTNTTPSLNSQSGDVLNANEMAPVAGGAAASTGSGGPPPPPPPAPGPPKKKVPGLIKFSPVAGGGVWEEVNKSPLSAALCTAIRERFTKPKGAGAGAAAAAAEEVATAPAEPAPARRQTTSGSGLDPYQIMWARGAITRAELGHVLSGLGDSVHGTDDDQLTFVLTLLRMMEKDQVTEPAVLATLRAHPSALPLCLLIQQLSELANVGVVHQQAQATTIENVGRAIDNVRSSSNLRAALGELLKISNAANAGTDIANAGGIDLEFLTRIDAIKDKDKVSLVSILAQQLTGPASTSPIIFRATDEDLNMKVLEEAQHVDWGKLTRESRAQHAVHAAMREQVATLHAAQLVSDAFRDEATAILVAAEDRLVVNESNMAGVDARFAALVSYLPILPTSERPGPPSVSNLFTILRGFWGSIMKEVTYRRQQATIAAGA